MSFLQVQDISKYNLGHISIHDLSFQQEPFENIAIAGETGSGKSTLLKMIAGLIQPDQGKILFENRKLLGPLDQLIPGHPSIAYHSQHFELRNHYHVIELLEMATRVEEKKKQHIIELCQIPHLVNRKTSELSGGEKQRVVLAMQMLKRPRLLLLDEPFSNLDAINEQIIKNVISDIQKEFEMSCILVSHDGSDVLSWADTIYILHKGRIIQQGSPQEIYHRPLNAYCAGLFGLYDLLPPSLFGFDSLSSGLQLLVRPEYLRVSEKSDSALACKIKSRLFYGAYYRTEMEALGYVFSITTNKPIGSSCETVYISFNRSELHYLSSNS